MLGSQLRRLSLGFLKKLVHKKPETEAEPLCVPVISTSEQSDEKATLSGVALEDCPICHDSVGVTNPEGVLESWVHLHCKHKFGSNCIQTWIRESAERDPNTMPGCPICRTAAKHSCGHPVVMPLKFPLEWEFMPPAVLTARPRRRRLVRRWGHPRQPAPQPVRPRVQTVGECQTCAVAALYESRRKPAATPNIEANGTMYPTLGRDSGRRGGIQSRLLPTPPRLPRHATLGAIHNESYGDYTDGMPLGRRAARIPRSPDIEGIPHAPGAVPDVRGGDFMRQCLAESRRRSFLMTY
ncbi:hypothetical protein F4802DRAFT_187211 [Xylaria palmicola]|nr:hypothetical protein F4802DRAFT_187211 [Xylaria palmicola]